MIEHDALRARRLLRELVAEMPRSGEARLLLARSHARGLEFEAALEQYQAAVAIDPRNAQAVEGAAFSSLALGRAAEALAGYERLMAIAPGPWPQVLRGCLLHRLGRIGESLTAYKAALGRLPRTGMNAPFALLGYAAALADAGRPDDARRAAQELNALFQRGPLRTASALSERVNSIDFHEWSHYADKGRLASSLQRHGAIAEDLRFPETFVLPAQRRALDAYRATSAPSAIYVVKPQRGTGGQGIEVGRDLDRMLSRPDEVIVQRYLDRPYLVDGRKGHLRVYGFVTSAAPLRAYAYAEGILRIAPEPYDRRPESFSRLGVHVTNTALHDGHPDLVIEKDPMRDEAGNIWSLSALLRRMRADGHDPEAVLARVARLVRGFLRVVRADGLFERQARGHPSRAFAPKLFGLDVLFDEDTVPWLVEMQRKPAAAGAPLVERINGALFATTLRMSIAPYLGEGVAGALALSPERHDDAESAQRGLFIPLVLD